MRSIRRITFLALLLLAYLSTAPVARAAEPEIPDTPGGEILKWFFTMMEAPTDSKIAERLGETLNDAPAPDPVQMAKDFRRIIDLTEGFTIYKIKQIDEFELDVLMRGKDKRSWWIATFAASPTPPYKVTALRLGSMVDEPTGSAAEWGDVTWSLNVRDRPAQMSIRAERSTENGSKPIVRLFEDTRAAIGPASKLFPIALFAQRASEDPTMFQQRIPLKRSLQSLISPWLGPFKEGEIRTAGEIFDLALADDLSAVDQLIGWLGRAEFERFVWDIQGDDSPNFPFLTTGEFYKLKTIEDGELYQAYVNAETEDDRRVVLADLGLVPLPTMEEAEQVIDPTRVNEVEWFASADEMCEMLRRIESAMDADPTGSIRQALNEVSPQNQEMGIWTFVMSVSGGEPGVFANAFLIERLDGVRFRFAIIVADPDKEIDYDYYGGLAGTFITLMAIDP